MLALLGFGILGPPDYYHYNMQDKMTSFPPQRQTPYHKACVLAFLLAHPQ